MIYLVAIFLSLVVAITGQDCSVCGDGLEVGNPNAIFTFAGQPDVPCGTLQDAGTNGQIPLAQCPFLPGLVGVCGCQDIAATTPAPGVAPVSLPTPAAPTPASTSAGGGCPAVPPSGCSVCGEGLCVGNPSAIFIFTGQPEVLCGDLEQAGIDGQVPLDQCPFLPNLVSTCKCGTGTTPDPSPSPTRAAVSPTAAPVVAIAPSPAPTPAPTAAPTPVPTPQLIAPSKRPTPPPAVPTPAPVIDVYGMGGAGGSGEAKDKGTMGMMQKSGTSMIMSTQMNRRALGMAGPSLKKASSHHHVRGESTI
jgi:hypothetical protein